MSSSSGLRHSQLIEFDARAERHETPAGTGSILWRIWGKADGTPIVLLHGAQGAWSHWIRTIDALADAGWRLFVPDIPGHGGSARIDAEGHAPIVDALGAGLRALGAVADGPVDIVGFSFGGVIAGHLVARHADVARRLILVGAGGLGTPVGDLRMARFKGLAPEEIRGAVRHNLAEVMLHDPASIDELAIDMQTENGAATRLNPGDLILPDKLVPALAEVRVQVDAIWGEFDRPHPGPGLQHAVIRRFDPDAEMVVIPDAGHWVMYERPERFNEVLLKMLETPLRQAA